MQKISTTTKKTDLISEKKKAQKMDVKKTEIKMTEIMQVMPITVIKPVI